MLIGALKLLLIGMTFVFLFLLFLMLVIQLVSRLFQKHALAEEKELFQKKPLDSSHLIAAITTAVHEYQKQN